jgi:hypothetical protein
LFAQSTIKFVSSFTAAYLTIKNKREFLQGLLDNDREAILRVASKLLDDEGCEGDEEDLIGAMEEALVGGGGIYRRG